MKCLNLFNSWLNVTQPTCHIVTFTGITLAPEATLHLSTFEWAKFSSSWPHTCDSSLSPLRTCAGGTCLIQREFTCTSSIFKAPIPSCISLLSPVTDLRYYFVCIWAGYYWESSKTLKPKRGHWGFCKSWLCLVLFLVIKLIDERLIKKRPRQFQVTVWQACFEVLGLPMFTNLSCLHVIDFLMDCSATWQKSGKLQNQTSFLKGMRGGRFRGWEEEGRRRSEVMRSVVWDHYVWLTFLIHHPATTRAAWIYKLEHTCSAIKTSDLRQLTSACYQSSG